jgi:hypothetical protein
MNRREWTEFCKTDHKTAYFWYNKARKKLLSKEFESDSRTDKDAKVIHHLRDTEEQRKYNDEHYEMFGFELDENGNESFTYGKYVVFWTKEHHNEYHRCSEETRKKRSESLKGEGNYWYGKHRSDGEKSKISTTLLGIKRSDDTKLKIGNANKGKTLTDETKLKISMSLHEYMNQPGVRESVSNKTQVSMTDEHKAYLSKIQKERITDEIRSEMSVRSKEVSNRPEVKKKNSEKHKELWKNEEYRSKQIASHLNIEVSQETRDKCSANSKRLWEDDSYKHKVINSLKQVTHSEEWNTKVRQSRKEMSDAYREYKSNGGTLVWNEFQKIYKTEHSI